MLLAAFAIGAWFFLTRDTGPIPKQYRKGLDFSIYYPARLPDGYHVDEQSFKREDDSLIFSIKAPNNRNIAVSEQALPLDAPSHKTPPVELPSEKTFNAPAGSVHISFWSDKYVADIITPETWIIMNVSGFTAKEASAIARTFDKVE